MRYFNTLTKATIDTDFKISGGDWVLEMNRKKLLQISKLMMQTPKKLNKSKLWKNQMQMGTMTGLLKIKSCKNLMLSVLDMINVQTNKCFMI